MSGKLSSVAWFSIAVGLACVSMAKPGYVPIYTYALPEYLAGMFIGIGIGINLARVIAHI